jgi:F-type H+-transporting ATPase subunit b
MSRHQRLFRRIALASSLAALPQAASATTGMPQLNFANPLTLDQVGWGAAIFVLFLLLSWVWGLPQVSSVLERRSAAIAADLEMARTAKTEADRAVAEMTDAIARARAEAQGSINAALEQAKQQAALQATALNEQLQTQLHEAELRINEARQTAMRALRQVATETAESVVARLTGIPAEPTRLQRAVAAALAARGQA